MKSVKTVLTKAEDDRFVPHVICTVNLTCSSECNFSCLRHRHPLLYLSSP